MVYGWYKGGIRWCTGGIRGIRVVYGWYTWYTGGIRVVSGVVYGWYTDGIRAAYVGIRIVRFCK